MSNTFKELVQAVLDGKTVEYHADYQDADTWFEQRGEDAADIIQEIANWMASPYKLIYRVKPEKKVFKYKTRPFSVSSPNGSVSTYVWLDQRECKEEQMELMYKPSNFKWLAPVTEHEVVYE